MYYPDNRDAVPGTDFNPLLEPVAVTVAKAISDVERYAEPIPVAYDHSESYGLPERKGIVFAESYPVGRPESKPITYGVAELARPPAE